MKRNSQQGVALVITLILLSVITFLAVTFLVVSRREGGQVNTVVQQSNAKNAADEGTQFAISQIITKMVATGNGLNFGMLVSTNYVSSNYVTTGTGVTNLTNVSYNLPTGAQPSDLEQMMNNLLILPRAPVFIYTNRNQTVGDFRYYLDLNRNGVYDTNGLVQNFDTNGNAIPDPTEPAKPTFSVNMGDPEWIGVLNRPEFRHSSSNFFAQRFAFIALPVGNSLDANFIHNAARQLNSNVAQDNGYQRNQGVGSWEINLAAFLYTLDTNIWPTYTYSPFAISSLPNNPNTGFAFDDAEAIVQYRYNPGMGSFYNYFHKNVTPPDAGTIFGTGNIDGFAVGPVTTNIYQTNIFFEYNNFVNKPTFPWPGAENPTAFFTPQDFFGAIPSSTVAPLISFTNRLMLAGHSKGTAERYAFYRMLSQMSFASSPEPWLYSSPYPYAKKINLNYNNIGTNDALQNFHPLSATNFVPWTPIQFFTNAADRMLRLAFANPIYVTNPVTLRITTNFISITNIPIYPANLYTPAVHRILQLAANIYDATTNRHFALPANDTNCFPSVFRPYFYVDSTGTNVSINGYVEDNSSGTVNVGRQAYILQPLALPDNLSQLTPSSTNGVNIYGVPWIVGAKKGLPNFNEFSMQTFTLVTRKVQIVKPSQTAAQNTWVTNIQYVVAISNVLGMEVWNSYTSNYARAVDITGSDTLSMYLTNENGVVMAANYTPANTLTPGLFFGTNFVYSTGANQWAGQQLATTSNLRFSTNSFKVPLLTNVVLLNSMVYHPNTSPVFNTNTIFDSGLGYIQPAFGLNLTNRLRYVMVDHLTGKVLDIVLFDGMKYNTNILAQLMGPDNGGAGGVWDTNRNSYPSGMINGVINQIQISRGNMVIPGYTNFTSSDWTYDQLQPTSQSAAINAFSNFIAGNSTNLSMQVPFTPTKVISSYYTWQANDPLVHYTLSDLNAGMGQTNTALQNPLISYPRASEIGSNLLTAVTNIGTLNRNYLPWANFKNPAVIATDGFGENMAVKDPLITSSDAWQFPTNAFPSVGWLGRVHRGTPWQTVYLKSTLADTTLVNPVNWMAWSGNTLTNNFGMNDPAISAPINDWPLMDLFTTAPNDNAERGQLSVNQTGLESWAAVLDGVSVITNANLANHFIDPSDTFNGTNTVTLLVKAINDYRTNLAGGVYTSTAQLFAVPQLTMQSPYILDPKSFHRDEVYERIPQQIMSLLRLGSPRYVIFSYGQSLKPADKSIVTSGQFFGMCTNYQITGEMATRTVVRIENYPVPGQAGPFAPRAVIESFNVLGPDQ